MRKVILEINSLKKSRLHYSRYITVRLQIFRHPSVDYHCYSRNKDFSKLQEKKTV